MSQTPASRKCVLTLLVLVLLAGGGGHPLHAAPQTSAGQQEPAAPAGGEGSTEDGAESAEPEEEPPDDRTKFQANFTDESGGGSAAGSAGVVTFDGENRIVLTEGVEVLYQDLQFRADEAELDQENKILTARGNIIVDQGPRRLTGETLVWDLDAKTGTLTDATGQVSSDYFFEGSEIVKTGENTYTIVDGKFTSCDQAVPPWSFTLNRARITVDGYAKTRGATLRFRNVPVFRLPYMLWPVRSERSSGFLIPKPGYSSRRGARLGLGYYQVFGPSYDTTLQLDLFSDNQRLGFGDEFRYHPSPGTRGHFEGYFFRDASPEADPNVPENRWRIRFEHESNDLPLGLRAVINLEDVSDPEFFRDFERRADRHSQRQLYSKGFVTGNWGAHSLNLLFDNRESFVNRTVTLRQLPEVEYKLRSTRLGRSPIYLQMRSALNYLDIERSATLDAVYGRADLFPQFTVPLRAWPWLSLSFTAGGRLTFYENSLFESEAERIGAGSDSSFRDESLTRTVPTASAEIVGPSFSRIFNGKGKRFSRFKHVIEPRWTYNFFEEFDERSRVPLFDEVDNLRGRNVGRFSLVNRLLAKPPEEDGGGAREILSLELFQDYSFDELQPLQRGQGEESREGPLTSLLRFNPSRNTSLRTEVRYNTLFSNIESTSLSGSYTIKNNHLGVRWLTRHQAINGATQNNQIRLSASLALVPNRLRLDALVNYDVNRQMSQLERYIVTYNGSCYSFNVEYGDYQSGNRRDREFRFALTLKNVGTFLEITGGDAETL